MMDQPARRRVESVGRRVFANARGELAGQLLAEFDAPLVEGIEIPQHAEAENLVLVERDELAQRERRQLGQDQRGRRLVAGKAAEGQQMLGNAGGARFVDGLAESQCR